MNVNKIAGSYLGFRDTEETRIAMSLQRRGKSINGKKKIYLILSVNIQAKLIYL